MGVDLGIWNALAVKPKSVADYEAEYDAADQRKLALKQNALAVTLNQQKADEYTRGIAEQNALSQFLGRGVDLSKPETAAELFRVAPNKAGGVLKDFQERQKTGAEVDHKRAQTEKEQIAAAKERLGLLKNAIAASVDQASYTQNLQALAAAGIDVSKEPAQFDPAYVQNAARAALTQEQRLEQMWKAKGYDLDVQKFGEAARHNRANEGLTARGQNLTDARGREANTLKAAEIAAGGKPPPGYRWKGDGTLEAIPGGPGDKLPEAQQKQVVGTQNLSNAINEYRQALAGFGKLDALSPDARAKMGTKYQNMLLQAKEAYNLGVLNGPDYEILQSVITDPRSLKGVVTSKGALDAQASELDRIMSGVAATSSQRRPQDKVAPNGGTQKIATVASDADYDALPSGATFVGPDGKTRRKP